DAADAALDRDGDGVSNLQEYLSGTDPRDPDSSLNIMAVRISGSSVLILFTAVAGKTYSLLKRDQVTGENWVKIQNAPVQSSTQEISLTLPNDQQQRFYRLVTPEVP